MNNTPTGYELKLHHNNELHVFTTCGCAVDISDKVYSILEPTEETFEAADRVVTRLLTKGTPCATECRA